MRFINRQGDETKISKTPKKQRTVKRAKVEKIDPVVAAWLEAVSFKTLEEANRFTENMNNSKGYEEYRMLGDFRGDKEKYESHMVIVVRKDELPDTEKMDAKAFRSWCELNDASPYLKRKNYEALKALLWALRNWKNVKPKPLKPGEYKIIRSRKDLPQRLIEAEQEAFWNTHRLSEELIKRLSGQELRDLGWKLHGKRVEGSKTPIKTPKNPIRTEEGRILITRASDIPDWHKLTYEEDANWYDEYELADHLLRPMTAKERAELEEVLGTFKLGKGSRRKK